jgi:spore germination protein Q
MVYQGHVETVGRDHIIISDPSTGKRYLLLMENIYWVEFGEEINYSYPEINPEVQATLMTTE